MLTYEKSDKKIKDLISEMYKKLDEINNENYGKISENENLYNEGIEYLLVKYFLEYYKEINIEIKKRGRPSKKDKIKYYEKKEIKIKKTDDIKWVIILEKETGERKKIHINSDNLKVIICIIEKEKKRKYEELNFKEISELYFYCEKYIVDSYLNKYYIVNN